MTQSTPPDDRSDLLARLGLPAGATDAEVRAAVAAALGKADDPLDDTDVPAPAGVRRPANRKPLYVLLTVAATIAVIVGVYLLGAPPAPAPAPTAPAGGQAAPAATPTPDAARVQALRAKLAANPNDVEAMAALGDVYSLGGDPAQAKEWHLKALAVQPDNTDLLLAYGVDLFNLGDNAGALTQWGRVTQLKPADVDAWYNIGWAHMQADPPDTAAADAAWQKVVELAPDSDQARTVRNHLPGAAATPTPTPSR